MEYDAYDDGDGPPLLLLHSGFCTWVEWRRTIALLTPTRRVLAPTLPGSTGGPALDYGAPTMLDAHADYVERLLEERGWAEVEVLGSSFGGVLALELLARGRASTATALAPPWTAGTGLAFYGTLFAGLPALRISRPLWPRTTRSGTINGLWFHQSRIAPEIDPEDVAALLESWSRFPFYRVGMWGRRRGPGQPALERIDQERATLVWSGADRLVPVWMRRRRAEALPGARVVHLDDFPHQPHLRDPRAVAGLVV